MITVTEEAKAHLTKVYEQDGKFPKLGVAGGGCAGFKYVWDTVDAPEEGDIKIDLNNGAQLIVDSMSLMFLIGTEISLNTGVFGTQLEITNPSAKAGCGCGESINFDMDMVSNNSDLGFQLPNE